MTPIQALREAALASRTNQFDLSRHALQRMGERNVTRRDICLALASATNATKEQGSDKWQLDGGCDDDGSPLGVVIVFTPRGLIVTVF